MEERDSEAGREGERIRVFFLSIGMVLWKVQKQSIYGGSPLICC
jgi:hypothetical protein